MTLEELVSQIHILLDKEFDIEKFFKNRKKMRELPVIVQWARDCQLKEIQAQHVNVKLGKDDHSQTGVEAILIKCSDDFSTPFAIMKRAGIFKEKG